MATRTLAPYAAIMAAPAKPAAVVDAARALVNEIRGNVAAWYAQPNTPVTYARFGECNRATWQRIVAAGDVVHEEVLRILREEQREP